MDKRKKNRNRLRLACGVLVIIALGLASRRYSVFPAVLGKYPGDALWAWMVFLGWALLIPRTSAIRLGALALLTSYAVEVSQLYQAPWINSLRQIPAAHLVLGSTFSWFDMVSYTVGVALGASLDLMLDKWRMTKVK